VSGSSAVVTASCEPDTAGRAVRRPLPVCAPLMHQAPLFSKPQLCNLIQASVLHFMYKKKAGNGVPPPGGQGAVETQSQVQKRAKKRGTPATQSKKVSRCDL
jgi:hypothetical protein